MTNMPALTARTADLRAVNSLTKYPSIPTYHALDPRNGGLLDEVTRFEGVVIGTEKIDGTNARIVLLPDCTYLIGSREHLLYAQGDLIGDPALGIAAALRPIADKIATSEHPWPVYGDQIQVLYGEVYGGKVTAASKQYTTTRAVGFRLFDMAVIDQAADKMAWPRERIAAWRDNGGQTFVDEDALAWNAELVGAELTPRLFTIPASDLPVTIAETADWLRANFGTSKAVIDSGGGRSEGVVLRTHDRKVITKARFEDYDRTLRRRAKTAGKGARP